MRKNVYTEMFQWVEMRAYIKYCGFFESLAFLYTLVSKNVVSVSDISALNLILGWCLFACSMNLLVSSLLMFQSEKMSSMKRFQTSSFIMLWLRMSVSTFATKMLAKATAVLVPKAVPCVCR